MRSRSRYSGRCYWLIGSLSLSTFGNHLSRGGPGLEDGPGPREKKVG